MTILAGLQHKFVRVKSTDNLDVQFFFWGHNFWYTLSSLVLEESASGRPSTFFSNPGQKHSSLGEFKTNNEMITVHEID